MIHEIDKLAEAVSPMLFGESTIRELNELGVHHDSRNKMVGSTQIRLDQLRREISQGAKTYYQRVPTIVSEISNDNLELYYRGKYSYAASENAEEKVLRKLGGNDYRTIATIDRIIDYLHPEFREKLEKRELAKNFKIPGA